MKNFKIPAEHKNIIPDNWLSGILKKEVYRIIADDLFIGEMKDGKSGGYALMNDLRARQIFMYAKVPSASPEHAKVLQEQGFYLADTNVLFEKLVSPRKEARQDSGIRFAVPADEEQVAGLAGKSFKYSRFHLDSAFSPDVANTIKAEWARNYFKGKRGDAMVVASDNDKVVGFAQLLKSKDGLITIDLIAVDSGYRGKGIAAGMISYAETRCENAKKIAVGTQLANIPSISCYEKMGFMLSGSSYVFHYHNPQ